MAKKIVANTKLESIGSGAGVKADLAAPEEILFSFNVCDPPFCADYTVRTIGASIENIKYQGKCEDASVTIPLPKIGVTRVKSDCKNCICKTVSTFKDKKLTNTQSKTIFLKNGKAVKTKKEATCTIAYDEVTKVSMTGSIGLCLPLTKVL